MDRRRLLVALAIVVGIVLIVVAAVYWAEPAKSLPSFFPGHSATATTHHIKHGIVSIAVAAALFVFAWFASGPRKAAAAR